MSEDVKGRRVLYIANPGSDSEGSEDVPVQTYTHPLRPNRPASKPIPAYHQPPAPLTTNLPSNHVSHHSSSHPSLSSPSSTSSPAAEESTPPPSTPGLPIPPVDLSSDGPVQEPAIASNSNERNFSDGPQITTTSRKGKLLRVLGSPFSRHPRPPIDTLSKRPRTVCHFMIYTTNSAHFFCFVFLSFFFLQSPTVSTPDHLTPNSVIPDKVLIVVTTDSDWYVTVDISNATNAAAIRECIFSKVCRLKFIHLPQLEYSTASHSG
jgi:hypothetical protein